MLEVPVEEPALTLPGVIGEKHCPCTALQGGSRFIEPDLSLLSHSDHEEVQASESLVILSTVFADSLLWNTAVRNVDVLLRNVNAVEEGGAEHHVAALWLVLAIRIILVDGVDLNIPE